MAGQDLRKLLKKHKTLVMPGAYNAFVAKQIEEFGFDGVYISGAGLANSLGVPDDGTLGLEDFVYAGTWITRAVKIPVICDADTGFENVRETVKKYIEAGLSGMHIEDQVAPKRCGHIEGKEIVSREEMLARLEEACAARDEFDRKLVIIARTDARGASNIEPGDQLEESIARGRLYRKAGADMIFPESLQTREEFARYRKKVKGYLLANMTEFGNTPFLSTGEFMKLGFNVVIFPVSLFRFHAGKTPAFLTRLKEEGNQKNLVRQMMRRSEINHFLSYKP